MIMWCEKKSKYFLSFGNNAKCGCKDNFRNRSHLGEIISQFLCGNLFEATASHSLLYIGRDSFF